MHARAGGSPGAEGNSDPLHFTAKEVAEASHQMDGLEIISQKMIMTAPNAGKPKANQIRKRTCEAKAAFVLLLLQPKDSASGFGSRRPAARMLRSKGTAQLRVGSNFP